MAGQKEFLVMLVIGVIGLAITATNTAYNVYADRRDLADSNNGNAMDEESVSDSTSSPVPTSDVAVTNGVPASNNAVPSGENDLSTTPTQEFNRPSENDLSTISTQEFDRLWRSETGKTRVIGLDSICYGNTVIESVETVFGYDKPPFHGSINITFPEENGCSRSSVFRGNFTLSGDAGHCIGNIVISLEDSDNFHLKWNITNLGLSCPVETRDWQISVYPG